MAFLPVLKRFIKEYNIQLETMADYPTYCDMFNQFIENQGKDRSKAIEEVGKFTNCINLVKLLSKPNIFM